MQERIYRKPVRDMDEYLRHGQQYSSVIDQSITSECKHFEHLMCCSINQLLVTFIVPWTYRNLLFHKLKHPSAQPGDCLDILLQNSLTCQHIEIRQNRIQSNKIIEKIETMKIKRCNSFFALRCKSIALNASEIQRNMEKQSFPNEKLYNCEKQC